MISSEEGLILYGSFPMSQLFTSGGQIIGASVSVSVLPMNIQGQFPLGLTGLISSGSLHHFEIIWWPKEFVLHMRWPKYWSFSFSISPSNEYSGLISFSIDCFEFSQASPCCPRDSRVLSSTTVWKYQFFGAQPSLWSNSHIYTWQNHSFDYTGHGGG